MKVQARCVDCGAENDLRPYGPNGAPICYPCAMRPERKHTAEEQMEAAINRCGPIAVLSADDIPRPLGHRKS
jgi:hypothetical protein